MVETYFPLPGAEQVTLVVSVPRELDDPATQTADTYLPDDGSEQVDVTVLEPTAAEVPALQI
jgi:hypothetical protein